MQHCGVLRRSPIGVDRHLGRPHLRRHGQGRLDLLELYPLLPGVTGRAPSFRPRSRPGSADHTLALPQQLWGQVQSDIMQVRNLSNPASLLSGNAGSILTRLQSASAYANQAVRWIGLPLTRRRRAGGLQLETAGDPVLRPNRPRYRGPRAGRTQAHCLPRRCRNGGHHMHLLRPTCSGPCRRRRL